jgi:hypothetical protein
MSELLRGPHHCVGIATSVTERIIHFFEDAGGRPRGTLSKSDLAALRQHFLASLPKAASYFEGVDRQYNEASAATAVEYVSRENILATLVFACNHKAARTAVPQAEYIGVNWLNQLCGGVAQYIRQHVCADLDDRLTKAYFESAVRLGAKLVVVDLLSDEGHNGCCENALHRSLPRTHSIALPSHCVTPSIPTSPGNAASPKPTLPRSPRRR